MVRPHSIQKCFVSKVDVSANAYAGGLVGDLYCGDIFGNIINANVTATLGAGGVSGRMFSLGYFASAPSSYPDTRVKRTIVTGTVSASSDRAGGLTFEAAGTSVTLTGLAIAAIAGVLLNVILPGNDYQFGKNLQGDINRGVAINPNPKKRQE